MLLTHEELVRVFDTWVKTYTKDPKEFERLYAPEDDSTLKSSGEKCAYCFTKIYNEGSESNDT